MQIPVDEISGFFTSKLGVPLPRTLRELVLAGDVVTHGKTSTGVMEWRSVREFAPEIADAYPKSTLGENLIVLHQQHSPFYAVYSPRDGTYLGRFNISSRAVDRKGVKPQI